MAASVYNVGGVLYHRSTPQGRKALPRELVKVPITIWLTPAAKDRITAKAKDANLSLSRYGEIAMSLFEFSASENC